METARDRSHPERAAARLLRTLPHREYRSGLYEVVKYGIIADPELFEFLERRMLPIVLMFVMMGIGSLLLKKIVSFKG